jgi:hypothetical protein
MEKMAKAHGFLTLPVHPDKLAPSYSRKEARPMKATTTYSFVLSAPPEGEM